MGLILFLLSYVSLLVHVCFVTISFAAGLYYISEIVEEYTERAKKAIKFLAFTTIGLYILLMLTESFSWTMIACGLLAQVIHLAILRNFPNIKIVSIEFWGAVIMLMVNHYLAYKHFQEVYYSLSEVSWLRLRELPLIKASSDFRILHALSVARALRTLRQLISQRPSATVIPGDSWKRQRRRHELLLVEEAPEPAQLLQIGQEQHFTNKK